MTMNGHFAGVGDAPTMEQYEHGIQVIDEEKEFKYMQPSTQKIFLLTASQPSSEHLSPTYEDSSIWLQLPPHFSLWLSVNRKVDIAQLSFWHGIRCDV
jgi:hypothetical protein